MVKPALWFASWQFETHNARLTEQIFDGGFCAVFAQKVTAEICPVQPLVMFLA
jgi:hypothetical protein